MVRSRTPDGSINNNVIMIKEKGGTEGGKKTMFVTGARIVLLKACNMRDVGWGLFSLSKDKILERKEAREGGAGLQVDRNHAVAQKKLELLCKDLS